MIEAKNSGGQGVNFVVRRHQFLGDRWHHHIAGLHLSKTFVSRRCSDRVLAAVYMYPIDLQELSLETDSPTIEPSYEFSETKVRCGSNVHGSPEMTSSAYNAVPSIVEIYTIASV